LDKLVAVITEKTKGETESVNDFETPAVRI